MAAGSIDPNWLPFKGHRHVSCSARIRLLARFACLRKRDVEYKARRRVRRKLRRGTSLVSLRAWKQSHDGRELKSAPGFIVRIPGIGAAAAVKPETLIKWIKGGASLKQVVAEFDRRGELIRAANGGLTRQVQIGDTRRRYYCLAIDPKSARIRRRTAQKSEDYDWEHEYDDAHRPDYSDDDGDKTAMRQLRESVENSRDHAEMSRRPISRPKRARSREDLFDW